MDYNKYNKIAIVIPIFNEAKNIENLVRKIRNYSKNSEIIFIDDNSRDGTLEILKDLSKKQNVSYFIRKKKEGYGSALKFGFEKAKRFDILITMDGDLSHDPKEIPIMIKSIKQGNDIVIGSRYIKKGKIKNWPLLRRITSKLTNFAVSSLLNTKIKDNTSGFRAYNTKFLLKILDKINSTGYFILEEILFLAKKEKAKIIEIPTTFENRIEGKSKAKMMKEAFGLIKLILKLRKKEISLFLKYCLVGLTGVAVNEGFLYFLTEQTGLYYLLSGAISIELSILSNFIFNDLWTFNKRKKGNGGYLKRMLKFNLARIFTAIINFAALFLFTSIGINYLLSNFIGIIIAMFLGFGLSIKWVWKYEDNK